MPRRSKNSELAALEKTIGLHVASRVRLRRSLLAMTQTGLAQSLGITLQQVQKYERGSSRISAGKLYRLGEILDVPVTFFFDGLERSSPILHHDADDRELKEQEIQLLRAWRSAPPNVADCTLSLLRAYGTALDQPVEVPGVAGCLSSATAAAATPVAPRRRGRPPRSGGAANQPAAAAASQPSPAPVHAVIPEPRRRGRPPGAGNKKSSPQQVTATKARPRGAVWDPSDIIKAGR